MKESQSGEPEPRDRVSTVAKGLQCSETTVYRLIRDHELEASLVAGKYLISRSKWQRLLQQGTGRSHAA